jgi:internalin A
MKNRLLPLVLVILCFALTSCNTAPAGPDENAANGQNFAPPTADSPLEPPIIAANNAAIQWVEPALEALLRQELNKPEGDIFPSDLDHVRVFRLLGDTHIAINVNPFDSRLNLHDFHSAGMPLKDGTYELDGKLYGRGSITSLADFANFRNIEDLRIYKNDLHDLKGLASLEKLEFLRLSDCAVQNIEDLAELRQIDTLDLPQNQISDIEPFGYLKQLKHLSVEYNPIASIDSIRTLEKLFSFDLSGTKVEDISILAEKTDLQFLLLKNMDVKSVDLAPLTTLNELRGLSVTQNRAVLLGIQVIGEFKELLRLEIASNDLGISEADITWLHEHLPRCQIGPTFDLL